MADWWEEPGGIQDQPRRGASKHSPSVRALTQVPMLECLIIMAVQGLALAFLFPAGPARPTFGTVMAVCIAVFVYTWLMVAWAVVQSRHLRWKSMPARLLLCVIGLGFLPTILILVLGPDLWLTMVQFKDIGSDRTTVLDFHGKLLRAILVLVAVGIQALFWAFTAKADKYDFKRPNEEF